MSAQFKIDDRKAADHKRRLLLRVLVKMMLWVSVLIGMWVFFSPLFKNKAPVNAKVVETVFDVGDMQPGDVELVEWFNKPLIIAFRDSAQEQALVAADPSTLRDPDNENSSQPGFADNPLRTSTRGWFVSLGLGTGSGCALEYVASFEEKGSSNPQAGGFLDRCDSSRYDLAGRVLNRQASRKNTNIPVWRFEGDKIIVSTEQP